MTRTDDRMHKAVLAVSLVLAGCSVDDGDGPPVCDDIGWPLGVSPEVPLPPPEFEVECAGGWANAVPTRPALDTVARPDSVWLSLPDPSGGWIHVVIPRAQWRWSSWLEQRGVDLDWYSDSPQYVMLRVRQDGELDWANTEFSIWFVDFVGDELWALGRDEQQAHWVLVFDPTSGELLDSRPWDLGPHSNRMDVARDPAGGIWITAIEQREADDLVDQSLYRAASIDTVELVAVRTTEDPHTYPFGLIHGLMDGAAAWGTVVGFEVIEPDGSVRWTHPNGWSVASGADSMLITSRAPTGVGAGNALRLENVALDDGAVLWTREHRRFEPAEPEGCGADGCELWDAALPVLRPDGGWLLVGGHAYPSSACIWQPLIMAVSADGDAEWAHRVETCGFASRVAFREDGTLELLGFTGKGGPPSTGAWLRRFEL
jgi:hypothetical protein